jgi:putative zinc finger/helix-turn-helix YgiT family protein
MKGICPICEDYEDLEVIDATETIHVRGEQIEVESKLLKCKSCGEAFGDPTSTHDSIDAAYRKYRNKHGMFQPEDIRDLRNLYGLTQVEMSKVLGWGLSSLSRYENGALQDEAHDKLLYLIKKPENLLRLIQETPEALSSERKDNLVHRLVEDLRDKSLRVALDELLSNLDIDKYTGYKKFDSSKLMNAILYFCIGNGILTTVLNKLLFYADFMHFKEYSTSITGCRYVPIQYVPVPDKWRHFIAFLADDGDLEAEEVVCSDDVSGEKYITKKNPDLHVFSETELKILASTKEVFGKFSAGKISDYSHLEKAYLNTKPKHYISYELAQDISF